MALDNYLRAIKRDPISKEFYAVYIMVFIGVLSAILNCILSIPYVFSRGTILIGIARKVSDELVVLAFCLCLPWIFGLELIWAIWNWIIGNIWLYIFPTAIAELLWTAELTRKGVGLLIGL